MINLKSVRSRSQEYFDDDKNKIDSDLALHCEHHKHFSPPFVAQLEQQIRQLVEKEEPNEQAEKIT